jgi:hypothetical protein
MEFAEFEPIPDEDFGEDLLAGDLPLLICFMNNILK